MEEKLGGPPPLEVSSMLLVLVVLVKSASVVCRHLFEVWGWDRSDLTGIFDWVIDWAWLDLTGLFD